MIIFNNIRMKDISLSEKTLLSQYKQLWQAQNWQGVADFLTAHPEMKYKIFDAENWNRIANTIAPENKIEIDYDYRNGDSSLNFDFVDDIDNTPENVSHNILKDAQDISESSMNFYYAGQWTSGNTYVANNLVTIDNYHLFYCIQQHEASNANKPTSTNGNQYWVLCKGFLGNLGNEGLIISQTQPAILTNQEVWIEEIPEPTTLLSGQEFSAALVSVVGSLNNIKTISFSNTLPTLWQPQQVVVSTPNSSEQIIAYCAKRDNDYEVVVYCPNTIYANANCSRMFNNYTNCASFDFSNFNTSKVTDMSRMFLGCSSVQSLSLNNFDTSKVTNMTSMFSSCTSLRSIYVDYSWTTDAVTSSFQMFYNCSNLSGVGTDGRLWSFNSSYINSLSAKIGTSTTTIPSYLTQSGRIIYFTTDGELYMSPVVTISQEGKILFDDNGAVYCPFKIVLNINPSKNTQIVAIPADWDYMEIRNQGTVIYQQSFHNQNLNYTITAGTVFDELYFYSQD